MSKQRETAQERIARMQRERQQAEKAAKESQSAQTQTTELVGQLTHESDGEPDFAELAEKLEARKEKEARGENEGHVKMTIYVEENLAKSFNALITKRGQQKQYINQALREFVQKKAKELGL